MSFVVSDCISRNQQRSNTVGQRLADADFWLFLNDSIKYFYVNYKLPSAQRETDLVAYPQVLEYPLPSDFIGLIEPKRPSGLHSPNFNHTTEREFAHWPYGRTTSIKFKGGSSVLILQETNGGVLGIDSCEDSSSWILGGDASGAFDDNQIFSAGESSLAFTLTPSLGWFSMSKTLDQTLDITDYKNKCKLFLDLYFPQTNTVGMGTVTVKLGTDASNHWVMTSSGAFNGLTHLTGFDKWGFDLTTASVVGSPSLTDVRWIQISGVDTGMAAGVYRLDNVFLSQGTYYQIPYYSKYVVQDSTGVWKEKITASEDVVVCPMDCDEAIEFKMLEEASAIRLKDSGMANYWARELKLKEQYIKSKYPRMESRNTTSWYKQLSKSNF